MYTGLAVKIFKIVFFIVFGIFALIGVLFSAVFVAMQFGLLNVRGSAAERNAFFGFPTSPLIGAASSTPPCVDVAAKVCDWRATPEWAVISAGLRKDQAVILQVSTQTGISPRMIAAAAVPEQIRFFTAEREVFKRYFEPLKILGSLSQFSLGVSGIKQETANKIEQYADDPTSPYYPGPGMYSLIAYPANASHDSALYDRLTDPKNHYYSYLYTALYIKEIEAQWQASGYDIAQNPAAVVTLFNIGFNNPHPGPAPAAGGAAITTGGTTYAYGELGADFYTSSELPEFQ